MRGGDTSTSGTGRDFPSTAWSQILSAGRPSTPEGHRSLELLARAYWKPVYAYIRTAWRKSSEDAKDLTQAFFAHLLAKKSLAGLRPELGSFRGFLKRSLRNFVIDASRAILSRQPERPIFSLDSDCAELDHLAHQSPDDTPEQAYDRAWFHCVLQSAIQDLRQQLLDGGKPLHFEVFRLLCLDPPLPEGETRRWLHSRARAFAALKYRQVAERLGLKHSAVRHYLAFCRATLRKILKGKVRLYAAGDQEVEAELADLLGR